MAFGHQKVPKEIPDEGLGSLRGCLVEGDADQRVQERKIRRRALAISIVLQSAVLIVLLLVPLFGKTERIAMGKNYIPIPPYGHPSSHQRGNTAHTHSQPSNPGSRFVFRPPTNKSESHPVEELEPIGVSEIGAAGSQVSDGPDCSWCVNTGDKNSGPRPPQPSAETHPKPRVVQITRLDPAMLIHRVEPIYPPLARQTRREGRVELRAIIAADGTIQSLQIVASDPLFDRSAVEAVQQWRYRPMILNGQPVEIDTHITVIYLMPR